MPNFRFRTLSLALAALALGLGCAGKSSLNDLHQSVLHFSAPSSLQPSDYYLDVDSGQDTDTITLKLVSPATGTASGLGFFLTADPVKVAWTSAGGADSYLREGTVFNLGTAPRLFKGKVSGGELQGGLFQKGQIPAATLNRSTVTYFTLKIKDGSVTGPVSLTASTGAQALGANGVMSPVNLQVGSLAIQ